MRWGLIGSERQWPASSTTSVDTPPDHPQHYTWPRVLPPACCPDWRCCFTVEPTPSERDGAAPNHETIEAEETGNNPPNYRETALLQDKGKRANPQTLHATIWGIGKTDPKAALGQTQGSPGVPYDVV
jgi:hypothetical protein